MTMAKTNHYFLSLVTRQCNMEDITESRNIIIIASGCAQFVNRQHKVDR